MGSVAGGDGSGKTGFARWVRERFAVLASDSSLSGAKFAPRTALHHRCKRRGVDNIYELGRGRPVTFQASKQRSLFASGDRSSPGQVLGRCNLSCDVGKQSAHEVEGALFILALDREKHFTVRR
jgi:hypothetical protein